MSAIRRFLTTSALGGILVAGGLIDPAWAGTATGTLPVSFTLVDNCTMGSITGISFGSGTMTSAPFYANGSISVTCNLGGSYAIGLSAGTGSGATTTTRKMTGPLSYTLNYTMWQNSGYTTNWGNNNGVDTLGATGTGSTQTFTVYGALPYQTAPYVGAYSDSVTVTVYY